MAQLPRRVRHSSFASLVLLSVSWGAACSGGGSSGRTGTAGANPSAGQAGSSGGSPSAGAAGSGTAGGAAGTTGGAGSGAGGAVGPAGAAGSSGASGASGSGAGTTGAAGAAGSSGQAGATGAAGAMECSWPGGYTGPVLGKCVAGCATGDCGVTTATGSFFTLDDFEGPAGAAATTIPLHWPSRDNRIGSWHSYPATDATATMMIAPTSGGSPDSKQAMHYSGTKGSYGATLSVSLTCYDASAYDGVSFWIKGDASAGNTQVRFNVHTPVTEPVASGGICTDGCYGHFGKMITLTPTWTRYKIAWADLRMPSCAPPTPALPAKFDPQKMILALSFVQVDPTKGFDFWVDDITFDIDTRPSDNFGEIVTQPIFNEIFKFKAPLPVFSYAGLVAAVTANGQGQLAQGGAAIDRKHEAAALLAQMSQETGGLTVVREAACSPTMTPQCTTYGTADQNYYGRGAIQLTYKANYDAANAVFPGISANPDLVASMTNFAFGTAVWFWMNKGCHTAMVSGGHNFGDTTRLINGALECSGGPNQTGAQARADLYTAFCAALGVNPTGQLLCP